MTPTDETPRFPIRPFNMTPKVVAVTPWWRLLFGPRLGCRRGPTPPRRRRTKFDQLVAELRARNEAANRGRRRHEKLTTNPKKLRRKLRRRVRAERRMGHAVQ